MNTNKKDGDDSRDGDVILHLITFETQNTSKKEDNKKKEEDSSTNSKSVAKRRRIESSSSSIATRTRSCALLDKNDNKDDVSNEQLVTLSTLVSDVFFSFDIPSTSPTRRKGKSSPSERKRASGAAAKNKGCVINIPGNLVLKTFASRVINLVNEGGKMAGNTLQRNSTDNYVNFFRKNVTTKVAAATTPISKYSGSTAKSR